MITLINAVLLTLLAVVTIAIVRQRNRFSVVILASVYSFLMASVLIVLDAVDVAMTEALIRGRRLNCPSARDPAIDQNDGDARPSAAPPASSHHIGRHWRRSRLGHASFCHHSVRRMRQFSNTWLRVTSRILSRSTRCSKRRDFVLADYRGCDTLGETTVIFTAGIGVLLLLHRARRRGRADDAGSTR